MVDLEIAATKGQMARDDAERFSADRYSPAKPKRVQEKRRRPYSVYVTVLRVAYEMYDGDDWVHVPDPDSDTVDVVEAYIHKPSSDVLANIAVKEADSIIKFWKKEGHDTSRAHTECLVDISDLYQKLVYCGNVRALVSVRATKTKLKP